jgi:hypothetical protein
LAIDYFIFKRSVDTWNGGTVPDKIGNELDITLGYNHTDNVGFELGYAMLSPDDALITSPGLDNDIKKAFARAKVKWGGQSN